jgi:hypothetical protein
LIREIDMSKPWEEMTTLEQYAIIWWDMYKDAYGVRPRGISTKDWTEEDFRAQFNALEGVMREGETW